MQKTSIEWVKNPDGTQGYTWNPITGCLNGCEYCYARKLANTRLRERYLANKLTGYDGGAIGKDRWLIDTDPFYPRFWPERLRDLPVLKTYQGRFSSEVKNALLAKQSKGIFVCDMSDLFGDWIPFAWQNQIFTVIKRNPRHRFYLLTKQPQNLVKFSPFPDNCWVGVTITNGDDDKTPLAYMKKIEAKVKFISFEPLLHWWDVAISEMVSKSLKVAGINWVIIGSQTKPTVMPKIEWVEEIVQACDKAGIPVFLKDNLKSLLRNTEGWTPAWAVSARRCDGIEYLRQELPK